jgi:capsular polysaccharide biosynthesis protein
MKDNFDGNGGTSSTGASPGSHSQNPPAGADQKALGNGHFQARRVDIWVVLDLLAHRWHWLVLGALFGGAGFFMLGKHYVKPKFTASATLMRYQTPGGASEFFKTELLSSETVAEMIRSPELLQMTSDQAVTNGLSAMPPEMFVHSLKIDPSSDSDAISLQFAARDRRSAVDYLNLYASNAVAFTARMQAKQARAVANDYLKYQVEQMDGDINLLREKLRHMPMVSTITNKLAEVDANLNALNRNLTGTASSALISSQTERLSKALGELDELMLNQGFTKEHPSVQRKEFEINSLKQQIARESTNGTPMPSTQPLHAAAGAAVPVTVLPGINPDAEIIQISLRSLEDGRVLVTRHEREAESYAESPPGILRLQAPATLAAVKSNMRHFKICLLSGFGGCAGMAGSLMLVLFVELVDNRLKTVDDLKRVTKLPVVGTLDNLDRMNPEARSQWAFRTWIMLQGRLSPSSNHGLVCGITSSNGGEGRSTWINLLAEAASLAGFRVLTIATRPSPTHNDSTDDIFEEAMLEDAAGAPAGNRAVALANSVLSAPAKVTEQLTGADSRPVVHIPLPGWVWNLERRKQWRDALNHWRCIENLVILVELPPASVAEAVLLGSNLPNLLWLTQSGKAGAAETRAHLATLRHAHCNLVGAVLNREPAIPVRQRFPRWLD